MAAIDYRAYILVAPVALVALVVSAWSVRPYRQSVVARSLIWYLVMVGLFLATNALELVARAPEMTIFWAKASHGFFLGTGLSWLAFALSYAGFETWCNWRVFRWLTVAPVVFILIIWTNELHHRFWQETGVVMIGPFLTMRPQYGPAFWLYGIYLYVLLLGGVALFLVTGARGRRIVQRQSVVVSLGALIPVVFNLMYVFRIIPGLRKDYTPVALALSGLFFYIAVHRYSLLRFFPIHHRVILEDVSSAVIALDAEGTVLDMNPRAETLLDIDASSVGSNIADVLNLADLLRGVPLMQRSNVERSRVDRDDRKQHFDIRIKPISPVGGRPAGSIVTINDVTSWVQLLEERNHLIELQTQLRRQERLATIGQLAAGMAHEISNPLTYIRSAFREIERRLRTVDAVTGMRSPSPEDLNQVAADVHDGLDRIESVVRSLLDYARGVTRDRQPRQVDFARLLDSSLALLRPALRNIEVNIETPRPLLVTCCDDEISQVLLNLFLNAVHAIESVDGAEERRIEIRARIETDCLRCDVSDTGPGIPPELRERIFEPFFSSKGPEQGTGLGLSISGEIIQAGHGGRLFLAEGLPTTFVIELPRSENITDG